MMVDIGPESTENASVNLKVIHLLHKLEMIDRDLAEIESMQGALKDDRAYTQRLRDSLVEEAVRLKELQTRIRSQVIRNPPAALIDARTEQPATPGQTLVVDLSPWQPAEIRVPEKKSGDGPKAPREKQVRSAPAATDKQPEDFNFRFVQN